MSPKFKGFKFFWGGIRYYLEQPFYYPVLYRIHQELAHVSEQLQQAHGKGKWVPILGSETLVG